MNNEPFRPVRGIGVAASVLIGLEALFAIGDGIASQRTADVVQAYADGLATMEDARAADQDRHHEPHATYRPHTHDFPPGNAHAPLGVGAQRTTSTPDRAMCLVVRG